MSTRRQRCPGALQANRDEFPRHRSALTSIPEGTRPLTVPPHPQGALKCAKQAQVHGLCKATTDPWAEWGWHHGSHLTEQETGSEGSDRLGEGPQWARPDELASPPPLSPLTGMTGDRQVLPAEHSCGPGPLPLGWWTPGDAAEAPSPREGRGAPGKGRHLALCSSEIAAPG